LIDRRGEQFKRLMTKADAVVAVCSWVEGVLERNGVPAEKITLSRQGIDGNLKRTTSRSSRRRSEDAALRLAYFGRLDPAKGVDLLTGALRSRPDAEIRLDVFAVVQPGAEATARALRRLAVEDSRLRVLDPLPAERVISVMVDYDLIAIPSRWLETGPLVALEAFAAGVPVLGANLGGIAELVRDGVDGVLLASDDLAGWADAIGRLARAPKEVDMLRGNVEHPRTMNDVAHDMVILYANLLQKS
jgi:glycosyltransferase involved in cell wall biosynthesis